MTETKALTIGKKPKTVTADKIVCQMVFYRRTDNRIVPFIVSAANKGGTVSGVAFDAKRTGGMEEVRIASIGTREGQVWPSLQELKAAVALDTTTAPG